jgi:hypothetical protein
MLNLKLEFNYSTFQLFNFSTVHSSSVYTPSPSQGWASRAIFRVESSPSHFEILSSRVESSRVTSVSESSQVESNYFFIISFSVYFDKIINKFFMTHYPVPSFYTQKNKNRPTKDKMT